MNQCVRDNHIKYIFHAHAKLSQSDCCTVLIQTGYETLNEAVKWNINLINSFNTYQHATFKILIIQQFHIIKWNNQALEHLRSEKSQNKYKSENTNVTNP